jgi:hypothetical protein
MQEFNLKKIASESDEWDKILFLGDGRDVIDDSVQNVMWESSRCQSVVLS